MTRWDIEARLCWKSAHADHCERSFFAAFDPELDVLPGDLNNRIGALQAGQRATIPISPGGGWIAIDASLQDRIRSERFRRVEVNGSAVEPRVGRFYPCGLLSSVAGAAHARQPFRVTARDFDRIDVDLNHPLAGRELNLEIHLLAPSDSTATNSRRDILASVAQGGPGMQARLPDADTDFYSDEPFRRADETDDALFYAPLRLVPHLDATARQELASFYARFLAPGMRVLDLMSSWDSHLPGAPDELEVIGLGMNAGELDRNPRLARRLVHDLNRQPRLPFPDAHFDAALCSLSFEYLTRPEEVWRDVARVLKPGAMFALALSERCFAPKAIRIWHQLHPFERMGLVLDQFHRSGSFTQLATDSLRGLPRPVDDKYARLAPWSDPLYVVWGSRSDGP